MNKYKFLDLSGYMFSGKTAVGHVIRELEGFCVSDFEMEFNLLRIQNGIVDLESSLIDNLSLIRSNDAIVKFQKMVKKFDGTYAKFPYYLFHFHSDFYNTQFNNKFTQLSNEYVNNLLTKSWKAEWPYPLYDMCETESFMRKIRKRLFKDNNAYENKLHLVDGKEFIKYTRLYLDSLMSNFNEIKKNTKTVVMNNSFEPFNAQKSLLYFTDAKCIIIRRDPRDMFATGANESSSFAKISHGEKVENFILRFKMQEDNTNKEVNKDILFLQYEDLVLDYENCLCKLYDFLEIKKEVHIFKKKYFNPEDSKAFIGIHKQYKNQEDIKLIEKDLAEYCLDI